MTKLLTVPQVAEALALKPKTIWSWIGLRKLAVHHVGRSVRIPASEVDRILAEGFIPATEQEL